MEFKRILLKLSGEALMGEKHFGIKKVAKMFPSPDEIKAFIRVRSE